ncbi:MAG: EamA family transporter [Clostridia bacterium]|nr:EamA family transporter [Clostridia bacterium]
MKNNKALICIILSGLLWGTSGIFVHYLAPYGITSMQMTAIRGVVSLIAIGIYILITDRELFRTNLPNLLFGAGAGLSMFITASAYYTSMQLTSVSTSVILMYTAPLFVMAYSVIFLKEKFTFIKGISVIGIFIGCALVSGVVGGMKYNTLGIIIGFISGIAYSAYNIFTKIEMNRKINPLTATFYCYVFMAFFAVIFSSPQNLIPIVKLNPPVFILAFAGLGVLTSAMPYFLYTIGLKKLPAGVASSLGIIEPLAATLYSMILFNEKLSIYHIIGVVLILCAVVLLSRPEEKE